MEQLPELVKSALSTACNSGKSLAWKIQESSKGILIQLVWKQTLVCASESGNSTRVGTNWKAAVVSSKDRSKSGKPARKKISPSTARRSARRLQAFLDRKQLAQVDSQKELDSKGVESVLPEDILSRCPDEGVNLSQCSGVCYEQKGGEHGVTYEMDGDAGWTPVKKKRRNKPKSVSASETEGDSDLDIPKGAEITYCDGGGNPSLRIRTRNTKSWVPIAARTRSRLKNT